MVSPLPPVTNTTNSWNVMDPAALRRARLEADKARLGRLAELEKVVANTDIEGPPKAETADSFWSRLSRTVGKGASLVGKANTNLIGSAREKANVENADGYWRKAAASFTDEMELLRKVMLPFQAISVSGGSLHALQTGGAHPATVLYNALGPIAGTGLGRLHNKIFNDAEASADRVARAKEVMSIIGKGFTKTAQGDLGAFADTAGELREMEEKSGLAEQFIYGAIFDPTILLGPAKLASMGAKVGGKAAAKMGARGVGESLESFANRKANRVALEAAAEAGLGSAPSLKGVSYAERVAARSKGVPIPAGVEQVSWDTLAVADLADIAVKGDYAIGRGDIPRGLKGEALFDWLDDNPVGSEGSLSLMERELRGAKGYHGAAFHHLFRGALDLPANVDPSNPREVLQDILANGFSPKLKSRLKVLYGDEVKTIETNFKHRIRVLPDLKEGPLSEAVEVANTAEVFRAAHLAPVKFGASNWDKDNPVIAAHLIREMSEQHRFRFGVERLATALNNHYAGKGITGESLAGLRRVIGGEQLDPKLAQKTRWEEFVGKVGRHHKKQWEATHDNVPISKEYNHNLDPYWVQDRVLLQLSRALGTRPVELLSIQWEDLLKVMEGTKERIKVMSREGKASRSILPIEMGRGNPVPGPSKALLKEAVEAYRDMLWGDKAATGSVFGKNAQYKGYFKEIEIANAPALLDRMKSLSHHFSQVAPGTDDVVHSLPWNTMNYRNMTAHWMRLNGKSNASVGEFLEHSEASRWITGTHYTQALIGDMTGPDMVLALHLEGSADPALAAATGLLDRVVKLRTEVQQALRVNPEQYRKGQFKGKMVGKAELGDLAYEYGIKLEEHMPMGALYKIAVDAGEESLAALKAHYDELGTNLSMVSPGDIGKFYETNHWDKVLRNVDEINLVRRAGRLAFIKTTLLPALDNVIAVHMYNWKRVDSDLKLAIKMRDAAKGIDQKTKKAKPIKPKAEIEILEQRVELLTSLKKSVAAKRGNTYLMEDTLESYLDQADQSLSQMAENYIKNAEDMEGPSEALKNVSRIIRESLSLARPTRTEAQRARLEAQIRTRGHAAKRNKARGKLRGHKDPKKAAEYERIKEVMANHPKVKHALDWGETRGKDVWLPKAQADIVEEQAREFIEHDGIREFLGGEGFHYGDMDIGTIKKGLIKLSKVDSDLFGQNLSEARLKNRINTLARTYKTRPWLLKYQEGKPPLGTRNGPTLKEPKEVPTQKGQKDPLPEEREAFIARADTSWQQGGTGPRDSFYAHLHGDDQPPLRHDVVLNDAQYSVEVNLNPEHHLKGVLSSSLLRSVASLGNKVSGKLERIPGFGAARPPDVPGAGSEAVISTVMGGHSAINTEAGRLVAALKNIWRGTSDTQDRVIAASERARRRTGFTFDPAMGVESRPFFSKPQWVTTLVKGRSGAKTRPIDSGSSTFFPLLNDVGAPSGFRVKNIDPKLKTILERETFAGWKGPTSSTFLDGEDYVAYHMRAWDMVLGEVPVEKLRFDALTNPEGYYDLSDEMYDFILYQKRLIAEADELAKKAYEVWGIDLTAMLKGQRPATYAPRAVLGKSGIPVAKEAKPGEIMQPRLDWTHEREISHYGYAVREGLLYQDGIQTMAQHHRAIRQTIASQRVKQLLIESGDVVPIKVIQRQVDQAGILADYWSTLRNGEVPSDGLIRKAYAADNRFARAMAEILEPLPPQPESGMDFVEYSAAKAKRADMIERFSAEVARRYTQAEKELLPDFAPKGFKQPKAGAQLRSQPLKADWLQDVYFTEDAYRQVKRLTETDTNLIMKIAESAKGPSQLIRFMKSGFDLGPGLIHGFPAFFENPKVWARAQLFGAKALWNPEVYQDYLLKHAPERQHQIDHGLMLSRSEVTEFFDNPSRIGAKLEKFPVSRRFVAAFNANLDMMRSELFGALEIQQLDKVGRALKAEELFEISAVVNKMTGTYNPGLAGVSQNLATMQSSLLFFAPMYRRAVYSMIMDVFRVGGGRYKMGGLRGVKAKQIMGKMVAAGLMGMTMAAALSSAGKGRRGLDVFTGDESISLFGWESPDWFTEEQKDMFDPTTPRFMSVNVGDHYMGIGTAFYSLFRLFGSFYGTMSDVKEEGTDGQAWRDFKDIPDNLLFKWYRGQAAPPTSLAIDLLSGRNFLGDPLRDGLEPNVENLTEHSFETVAPFWLDHNNLVSTSVSGKVAVAAEFFGFRTFPLSVFDRAVQTQDFWVKNSQLPELIEWRAEQTSADDLEWANLPVLLKRMLRDDQAEIREADDAISELQLENGGVHDEAFIQFRKLNDTNRKMLRDKLQAIDLNWAEGGYASGKDFRETYKNALLEHRARSESLIDIPQYTQVIADLTLRREHRLEKGEGHKGDLMFDAYATDVLGADITDDDGNFDHDVFQKAKAAVLHKFGDDHESMAYVEDRLAYGKDFEAVPSIKAFEDAKKTLGNYWKIHYVKWGENHDNARLIDEYIARGSSRNKAAWLRQFPQYRWIINQWSRMKEQYRRDHPAADVALVRFYDASPRTDAGKEAFKALQRNWQSTFPTGEEEEKEWFEL